MFFVLDMLGFYEPTMCLLQEWGWDRRVELFDGKTAVRQKIIRGFGQDMDPQSE